MQTVQKVKVVISSLEKVRLRVARFPVFDRPGFVRACGGI
jgi:hypothetical protein